MLNGSYYSSLPKLSRPMNGLLPLRFNALVLLARLIKCAFAALYDLPNESERGFKIEWLKIYCNSLYFRPTDIKYMTLRTN